MDPDQALEDLRSLTEQVNLDMFPPKDTTALLYEFAEKFRALDEWLTSKNGFIPKDWYKWVGPVG